MDFRSGPWSVREGLGSRTLRQFQLSRLPGAENLEIVDSDGNTCSGLKAFHEGQEKALSEALRSTWRDFSSFSLKGSGGKPASSAPQQPDDFRLSEVLAKLDKLVGLSRAKSEIKELISLIKVAQRRRELGIDSELGSFHALFVGNPGTGKTTFARIYAEALLALGALPSGNVVEVTRADLVAGYVGQTALKVREVLDRTDGGILFIDEAYALVNDPKDTFGQEALAELIKAMEDRRDRIAVVLAGYVGEMGVLVDVNPGLKSRVLSTVHFDDYSIDELVVIAEAMATSRKFSLHPELRSALAKKLLELRDAADGRSFGNAREARNIIDRLVRNHAVRVSAIPSPNQVDLTELRLEDIG